MGLRSPAHVAFFALAVAVAFADSSIVVLALPELYLELDASIEGIAWVITSYNLVVAVAAFALLPFVRRLPPGPTAFAGLGLFLAASVACALAGGLATLVAARSAQGLGAALFLAVSLTVLAGLAGSARRGLGLWTTAAAFGAAAGPALGGLLTELFDWRAIFVVQAPVAALALLAAADPRARGLVTGPEAARRPGLAAANIGLALVFAALVGALFLAVLLVVTVWGFGPLAGAALVSALPAAAVLVRPLARALPDAVAAVSGAVLLAAGLAALALLPAASGIYAGLALAVCGAGFGLAVPTLTRASVGADGGAAWNGTLSVGARHAGLVLGLVLVAPLLAAELERGAERATVNGTAVVLDARLPLQTKVPIVLSLRDEFERVPEGEVPNLVRPFEENGARDDEAVAGARDDLLEAIEAALTRSFRTSFALAAGFALLAAVPALALRRRPAR
ncbi:MAG TPA: MFS transporter [Gaiellaceae bacterium]|nr:MFS transporter [Gaiellaceae bacterium]